MKILRKLLAETIGTYWSSFPPYKSLEEAIETLLNAEVIENSVPTNKMKQRDTMESRKKESNFFKDFQTGKPYLSNSFAEKYEESLQQPLNHLEKVVSLLKEFQNLLTVWTDLNTIGVYYFYSKRIFRFYTSIINIHIHIFIICLGILIPSKYIFQ